MAVCVSIHLAILSIRAKKTLFFFFLKYKSRNTKCQKLRCNITFLSPQLESSIQLPATLLHLKFVSNTSADTAQQQYEVVRTKKLATIRIQGCIGPDLGYFGPCVQVFQPAQTSTTSFLLKSIPPFFSSLKWGLCIEWVMKRQDKSVAWCRVERVENISKRVESTDFRIEWSSKSIVEIFNGVKLLFFNFESSFKFLFFWKFFDDF